MTDTAAADDHAPPLDPAEQEYELVPIDSLEPHPDNPNVGDDEALEESIGTTGFYGALICQRSRRRILVGHTRWRADTAAGATTIPVIWVDCDDVRARKIMLGDNEYARRATTDQDLLALNLQAILDEGADLVGTGYDAAFLDELLAGIDVDPGDPDDDDPPPAGPTLVERFLIPPFTVLDARQGYWLERKRQWLALGLRSEVGRGGNLAYKGRESLDAIANADRPTADALVITSLSGRVPTYYAQKEAAEKRVGRKLTKEEFEASHLVIAEANAGGLSTSGTSVFDPVLCEIAYRWFSPHGGHVLDPFAGGSVRGIVAAALGRAYTGVELRSIQVEANRDQWTELGPRLQPAGDDALQLPAPTWIEGDSAQVLPMTEPESVDLLFSCPPYADLEVYSDDQSDISNMPWPQFLDAYRAIIAAGVAAMRPHRFAAWVIGDVRGPDGCYRGLVAETIRAFEDAGAHLYNEAILVTPLGSLQVRVGRQFDSGRKMGKTHQNLLVFVKGDPSAAAHACGTVEVDFPDVDAAAAVDA